FVAAKLTPATIIPRPKLSSNPNGCSGTLATPYHVSDHAVEEIPRIVRSRRSLRVVLNREDRLRTVLQPLDRAIVEVDVGRPQVGSAADLLLVSLDGETVILRGDLHHTVVEAPNRVVPAAVAVEELVRARAERAGDELMPETDAEDRRLPLAERTDGFQH